jgi:tetratricopeptide (TPR) repeat protein
MEYVDGQPIDRYCNEHKLSLRERLRVFLRVCDAAHLAHQKLIVHRDLKPDNILVTSQGVPKLLDFGIAKVLDPSSGALSKTVTQRMTPEYASPEQVRGEPVTTLTDIYSLGCVLYKIVTGVSPHQLQGASPAQAVQIICEREVPDPRKFADVPADVANIMNVTLRKELKQRYGSAQDLAQDISRYLGGLPVLAHRGSFRYVMTKFIGRHKLAAAFLLTVLTLSVGGISAIIWQGQIAMRQRDRAADAERAATQERDRALSAERTAVLAETHANEERTRALSEKQRADTEATTARAINDFLNHDLLAQASADVQAKPGTKPDPDIKVRTALDRAAANIAGKFDKQPLVEASIRQTIGETYNNLGLFSDAQAQFERALALYRRPLGGQHTDALPVMNDLALVYLRLAKYAQAEPLLRTTLELRKQTLGEAHQSTLESLDQLSGLYYRQGRYPEAEALVSRALELRRRTLGEEHPDTLSSEGHLGQIYQNQGQVAKAEPLLTKVFQSRTRVLGEEHPDTLGSAGNLGLLYRAEKKYSQAESLLAQTVEIQRRTIGEEHPNTLITMSNLANVYKDEGKLSQAEPLLSRVLEVRKRTLGDQHPYTLLSMSNLGILYRSEGKYDEGAILLRKVLDQWRRTLGYEHPNTLNCVYQLARLYVDQGKDDQAEPLLTSFLEIRRRSPGARLEKTFVTVGSDTAAVFALLGRLRLRQRKYSEAEAALREALDGPLKGDAEPWQKYEMQSLLGASLVAQARFEEAERLLLAAYQELLQDQATIPWDSRSVIGQNGERIIELYEGWGKPEKAKAWRLEHPPNPEQAVPSEAGPR